MKELSLYQISSAFPTVMQNEDLSEEEKNNVMLELKDLLIKKSGNIIGYIQNLKLTESAMKAEEERLKTQRKAIENKKTRIEQYVMECMKQINAKSIETPLGTIALRSCPISVDIQDEEKIPSKYKKVVVKSEVNIDKKQIIQDFKDTGELIGGVKLNTQNTTLTIK